MYINVDGDTIEAPNKTRIWIEYHSNYWGMVNWTGSGSPGWYEILLKWTNGSPPDDWPGTLTNGNYYVCGFCEYDGIKYYGESSVFSWNSAQTDPDTVDLTLNEM
ncbi:MAG: hypothetical protein JXA60_01840 [Candidatus Coatesbacteria bacterium]|nr:hypothetical protein [Candidatus Coatesbacteria bacterium]